MSNWQAMASSILPRRLRERLSRPVYHDRPSGLTIATFDGFEIAYRKNTADEGVLAESFSHDGFFSAVREYHPAEDHVILDVGAHIGAFALLAASKVPKGQVYAIEACQDTYNFLRLNVALNQVTNISIHRLALMDRRATVTLHHDSGNWGHSTVKRLSRHSEQVPARSLADFMAESHIAQCDLAKLNCEGAEFPILLNAPPDVLRRFSTLLVLYHCDLWTHHSEGDLCKHLENSGFTTEIRNRTRYRGWIVARSCALLGYNRARP